MSKTRPRFQFQQFYRPFFHKWYLPGKQKKTCNICNIISVLSNIFSLLRREKSKQFHISIKNIPAYMDMISYPADDVQLSG